MTTAWANVARGRVVAALRANVTGTLLGAANAAVVAWLLASTIAGRWLGRAPDSNAAAWAAVGVAVLMLIEWGFRLAALNA